jgi:DNA-binding beta-propeller fold protein YncE/4-amino-4-deoxy-L-arabinose transferase-like glycosyltransferase
MQEGLRHSPARTSIDVSINLYSIGGLVALVTVLALLLRLLFLAGNSFWYDEILSVRRARLGWAAFWDLINGVPPMTLYYVLLRYWLALGDSDLVVRLLSVIPAVATVPLVYLLGTRLFGVRVGLIAVLLLTVNAFHIQYSQEARSYSLLMFFVTLSSYFFVRGIERPSRGNWVGYILASALAFYSHHFAALALFAHAASLPFLPGQHMPWKKLVVSGAAIALVLFWPMGFNSILEFNQLSGSGFSAEADLSSTLNWRPELSPNDIYRFALDITGSGGNLLLLAYLVPLVVACIAAVRTWVSLRVSYEGWKYAFLISWLFLPIFLTIVFSILVTPVFISRYLIISLTPLVLLVAIGIPVAQRLPLISAAAVVVILMFSAQGAYSYYTEFEKQDWRGVARFIASEWQPGDGMLYYVPWMDQVLDYYLQEARVGPSEMRSVVSKRGWTDLTRPSNTGPTREAIAEFLPDEYNRIWLVLGHTSPPWRQAISQEIQAALGSEYPFSLPMQFSELRLVLYSKEDLLGLSGQYGQAGCQTVGRDSSGNAHHGILMNQPVQTEGQLGEALDFDGTNDHVLLGDVHGFQGTEPFTVSLWARDSGRSGVYGRLVSKEKIVGAREGWLIFNYKDGTRYGFERWQGGDKDSINFEYNSGQWNHIAFTYDGVQMKGYLNGELVAGPAESTMSIPPTFNSLVIGARSDAVRDFYQGALDDIRIYDRALNNEEVADLAQITDPAQLPDGGLVAYWAFDEASSDTETACGDEDGSTFPSVLEPTITPTPTDAAPTPTPAPTTGPDSNDTPVSGISPTPTIIPVVVPPQPPVATPTPTPMPTPVPTPTAVPTPAPTVAVTPTPEPTAAPDTASGGGGDKGQFRGPRDIAVSPGSGRVYVADTGNHRIQVFSSTGLFLFEWGSQGGGPGQFEGPSGIAIDPTDSKVYVADTGNHRIQVFNTAGIFLFQWGGQGNGRGQFEEPGGVVVNPTNSNVYVADTGNDRVQVFNGSGVFFFESGSWGTSNGEFRGPTDIAADPSTSKLYVLDSGNNRVQVIYENGEYYWRFGRRGDTAGRLSGPRKVELHPLNNYLYITDTGNQRVQAFDLMGRLVFQWGLPGDEEGPASEIHGIGIDPNSGRVYVADAGNHRVWVFGQGGTYNSQWGQP